MKKYLKPILNNLNGSLNQLDVDRRLTMDDYIFSLPNFFFKGILGLIAVLILFLLLLSNIVEREVLLNLYQAISFIIMFLGFMYLILKLVMSIPIKRYAVDLGITKDMLRLVGYTSVMFLLFGFNVMSLGVYEKELPDKEKEVEAMLEVSTNFMNVLNFMVRLVMVSIGIRLLILLYLTFVKRDEGKRTRIKEGLDIKLKRKS